MVKNMKRVMLGLFTLFSAWVSVQAMDAGLAALWAKKDKIEQTIEAREAMLKREKKTLEQRLRDPELYGLRQQLHSIDSQLGVGEADDQDIGLY